jgi:hypothetical protein
MSTSFADGNARPRNGASIVKTLLFFESMITPKIITFIYWLALLGAVIGGIGSMFAFRVTFASFMTGIGIIIGGALAARIGCELLIVLFKINEHTHTMANRP